MFLHRGTFHKSSYILTLLTAIFLTLSFPSFEQSYLMWFALVPWFIVIKYEKKVTMHCILIGTIFFLINLAWLRHVTYFAWILLSLYSMGFFIVFGLVTNTIIKNFKLPFAVIAPIVWVSLEFLRSFLLTGFPWLFIGHSQYQSASIIQIADITGVYGVSFLIVFINAAITEFIFSYDRKYKSKKATFFTINIALPILMVMAIVVYGHWSLKRYVLYEGPTVSVVQGNIPQSVKNNPDEAKQIKNLQKYLNLSLQTIPDKPDLVVWPETMVPGLLNINPDYFGRKIDSISQGTIQNLAYILNTHLLIGGTSMEIEDNKQIFYNSAFYFDKKGTIVDRYDKIHLVPFGEYTPLKNYLPFLTRLVPYETSLSPGKERILFDLQFKQDEVVKFATLICFEDSLPTLTRKFCKDGANFLINITNDGWFKNSAELDQHLTLMVFRAIENRVGIARAANTGISAFVDPIGNITHKLQTSEGVEKDIDGVLTKKITIVKDNDLTFYTKHGDVFAMICSYLTIAIFVLANIFRGRK